MKLLGENNPNLKVETIYNYVQRKKKPYVDKKTGAVVMRLAVVTE